MPKIAIYKFLTFFIFAYDALNEPRICILLKKKEIDNVLEKFGWRLIKLLKKVH